MDMTRPCPTELELCDVEPSDPWATIRRASCLISRRVGLIRQLATVRYQAQDPAFFAAGVAMSDFSRSLPGGVALTAGGAGETEAVALASAIGEAVERHSACFYDREEMVYGAAAGLGDDAVAPERLRLFSREQSERLGADGANTAPYFDDHSRTRWVWGWSLTAHRPRLVPASRVYLNYRPESDETPIGHHGSTGLAAGATREEAILTGLLETVERDAFISAWLHRQPGRALEVDDDELRQVLRDRLSADRPSVQVRFFDLTTDVPIPVIFLVMNRLAEVGPITCLGAASRLSPRRAMRKSIQEGGQNLPVIRNLLGSERAWQPAPDFSNVTTFDYHFLTYLKRPDLVSQAFAFYDACADRIPLSHLTDRSTGRVRGDIEYCVDVLRGAGYEVIVVDVTTPDVAAAGLSVMRVIVPGLVPLHSDHRRPFLGVRRLFELPFRLGWDRRGWNPEQGLNPFPHPFP
jgi:ribosomal protein S12 methylthiotransferase accessory factor